MKNIKSCKLTPFISFIMIRIYHGKLNFFMPSTLHLGTYNKKNQLEMIKESIVISSLPTVLFNAKQVITF